MRRRLEIKGSVGCCYQLNVGITTAMYSGLARYMREAGFPSIQEAVRSIVIAELQDRSLLGPGEPRDAKSASSDLSD